MLLGTKKALSIVTNLTMDDPHHNPPPHHRQTTPSHHHHHQRRHDEVEEDETLIRDIHALQPPTPPPSRNTASHRQPWDTTSHGSSSNSMSMTSDNFTTISREFSALVVAGSAIRHDPTAPDRDEVHHHQDSNNHNMNMMLAMIGEGRDEVPDHETNPLAIVHQQDLTSHTHTPALASPGRIVAVGPSSSAPVISVHSVKKEEIESKITAWQNAKVAKTNNRFKREDAIIGGWENAQVERASASMKKVERKLEEKRARALEKMQNDVAKARRKAEEKRASAEAKRGTKVAKVYEICNLMRAVGRAPTKRSFF